MRLCSATFFLCLEINIILAGVTNPKLIRKDTDRESCINPYLDLGHCVPMNECESLKNFELNSNHVDDHDREFLQNSRCSAENEDLKICCPTSHTNVNERFLYKLFGTSRRKHATKSNPAKVGQPGRAALKQPTASTKFPTPTSEFRTQCGNTTLVVPNVMNGLLAKLGDYPWVVALCYNNTHKNLIEVLCGGSIILDEWVLTAAHCVQNPAYELTHLRLRDLDVNDTVPEKATPINVDFSEIFIHPGYSRLPVIINDIALIRLKNKIRFQKKLISPICLPGNAEFKDDTLYSKVMPLVAGWGFSDQIRKLKPTHLNYAQIKFTKLNICKEKYKYIRESRIDGNVLCAGDWQRDACGGDSGGPLMVIRNDTFHIAGIVSYGVDCGKQHNVTGVYTKVASYLDWVQNTTSLSI